MIKVEKNISIPDKNIPRGRERKYPFLNMEIGDSFFCETPIGTLSPSAYQVGKKFGMKFTLRSVDGGVRVWRIA